MTSDLHVCPYCAHCGRAAYESCPLDWLDDERCSSENCAGFGTTILGGEVCDVHGRSFRSLTTRSTS